MSNVALYVPTPATIAQACAAVRAGWSQHERHRRAPVPAPVVPRFRPDRWRKGEVRFHFGGTTDA